MPNCLINGRCCCITTIITIAVRSIPNHATTAVIEPTGCDGINIYYYRILLTVTDPAGAGDDAGSAALSGLWARHAADDF